MEEREITEEQLQKAVQDMRMNRLEREVEKIISPYIADHVYVDYTQVNPFSPPEEDQTGTPVKFKIYSETFDHSVELYATLQLDSRYTLEAINKSDERFRECVITGVTAALIPLADVLDHPSKEELVETVREKLDSVDSENYYRSLYDFAHDTAIDLKLILRHEEYDRLMTAAAPITQEEFESMTMTRMLENFFGDDDEGHGRMLNAIKTFFEELMEKIDGEDEEL